VNTRTQCIAHSTARAGYRFVVFATAFSLLAALFVTVAPEAEAHGSCTTTASLRRSDDGRRLFAIGRVECSERHNRIQVITELYRCGASCSDGNTLLDSNITDCSSCRVHSNSVSHSCPGDGLYRAHVFGRAGFTPLGTWRHSDFTSQTKTINCA
jgi:hypothetical protein